MLEAADWHDGTDLADIYRAISSPEGLRRLICEARLFNQGKDRWNGSLAPSQN